MISCRKCGASWDLYCQMLQAQGQGFNFLSSAMQCRTGGSHEFVDAMAPPQFTQYDIAGGGETKDYLPPMIAAGAAKFVLTILVGLVLLPQLWAGDVFVPKDRRPRNQRGNCVWCAAETICWGAGNIWLMQGQKERAVAEGWNGAGLHNVTQFLKDHKIEFESQSGTKDTAILYRGVANGTGCYVDGSGHAMALVGVDPSGVRIIDNNGPAVVQNWNWQRFNNWWCGDACYPKMKAHWRRVKKNGHLQGMVGNTCIGEFDPATQTFWKVRGTEYTKDKIPEAKK